MSPGLEVNDHDSEGTPYKHNCNDLLDGDRKQAQQE